MYVDKEKERKQKIVLFTLLIIAALVAFYQYVLAPEVREAIKIRQGVMEQRERLEELQERSINIVEPERRIIEIQNIEKKEEIKKLPYIMDLIGLFIEFNYLFIIYGFENSSISFGNPSHTDTFSYFNINLNVGGKLDDVERFIDQMQNFRRLSSVEQMALRVLYEDNEVNANMNMTLKVYFYTEGKNIREPSDYDFLESRYGIYENFFDILRNISLQEG